MLFSKSSDYLVSKIRLTKIYPFFSLFQSKNHRNRHHNCGTTNPIVRIQNRRNYRTEWLRGMRNVARVSQFHERGELHRYVRHTDRTFGTDRRHEYHDRQEFVSVQETATEWLFR